MNETPYNKLPRVDLHGGAGSEGPMDGKRATRGAN